MTRSHYKDYWETAVRDNERTAVYVAEDMVLRMFKRSSGGVVEIAGATITLPIEMYFGNLDAAQNYVDRVLALPAVRAAFSHAQYPVTVRARRGVRQAHYQRGPSSGEIALPAENTGGLNDSWALRELIVLHELAHHLTPTLVAGKVVVAHGVEFVETLIELVGLVLGPEATFVYRATFLQLN